MTFLFEHVGFKYDPHSPKMTIEDVSLTIPETKVTAIVGASGSGKTTLLKLLLGYYPVMKGEIKIGEANLNSFNLKWWRRQCGVVMQDGVIFSESIARNIAVDDGDIDGERLLRAVEIANIKRIHHESAHAVQHHDRQRRNRIEPGTETTYTDSPRRL